MPAWIIPAVTAAAGLIGSAMAKGRDQKQIYQQDKLNDLAVGANKQMAMFNRDMQMQMWRETGPMGQIKQLKGAGLNPSLIYGMGGAGGQTAAAAQGAGIAAGQAPGRTGNEIPQMTSMGMGLASQMGLLNAQKENIEANTEKTKAETAKTTGVDTQLGQQQILTGKAQQQLTETQNEIARVQQKIITDSAEDAISTIRLTMQKADQDWQSLVRNNSISQATYDEQIKQIKANLQNTLWQNKNIQQAISESTSRMNVNEAEIKNMLIQRAQDWEKIYYQGLQTNNENRNEKERNFLNEQEQTFGIGKDLLKDIFGIFMLKGILGGEQRNVIQGFKR